MSLNGIMVFSVVPSSVISVATDVISDTDDLELSAMVERLEQDIQGTIN